MKVSIRHLGPSMIQQMQHPCNECKGTGETINDKDRCSQCKGEKVVQEKKVLEVIVEKGMQNAQKITFPGEADEAVTLRSSWIYSLIVTFQHVILIGFHFDCLFSLTLLLGILSLSYNKKSTPGLRERVMTSSWSIPCLSSSLFVVSNLF